VYPQSLENVPVWSELLDLGRRVVGIDADDRTWRTLAPLGSDLSTDVCVIGLGGSGLTAIEEFTDCARQRDAMRADGIPVEDYAGQFGRGLFFPGDATFNPLARCRALSFSANEVVTTGGRIRGERVIVAVDGRLESLVPDSTRSGPRRTSRRRSSSSTGIGAARTASRDRAHHAPPGGERLVHAQRASRAGRIAARHVGNRRLLWNGQRGRRTLRAGRGAARQRRQQRTR
jgi:hypothetical protein